MSHLVLAVCLFLLTQEEKTNDLMREMEDVMHWANRHLIDAFKKEKPSRDQGKRGRRLIRPGDCTLIYDPMEMEPLSQTMLLSQTLSEGSSSDSVVVRGLSATFSLSPKTEFAKSMVEVEIFFLCRLDQIFLLRVLFASCAFYMPVNLS